MISSIAVTFEIQIAFQSLDTIKFDNNNKNTALGSDENFANMKITRKIDCRNRERVHRSK